MRLYMNNCNPFLNVNFPFEEVKKATVKQSVWYQCFP